MFFIRALKLTEKAYSVAHWILKMKSWGWVEAGVKRKISGTALDFFRNGL